MTSAGLFLPEVRGGTVRTVAIAPTFDAWRAAARELLCDRVRPEHVEWCDTHNAQGGLLSVECSGRSREPNTLRAAPSPGMVVPGAFITLAASVACHSDHERWHLLYKVLWRITHGEPSLLRVVTDPEVHRLVTMDRGVRRAVHKMHAFVRFRAVEAKLEECENGASATGTTYVAWFEPMHHVVQRASGLFVRRFASMRWSILTPLECAHWDGSAVHFTPGVSRALAPSEDVLEELWRSYYAHIFNPARVALGTMQAEMPKRYWHGLPEAALIAQLTRDAPARVVRMLQQLTTPAEVLPAELQSETGSVTVPVRQMAPAPGIVADLDSPGEWDTVHDPGATAARGRAQRAYPLLNGVPPAAPAPVPHMNGVPVRVGTASWTDPTLLRPGVFYPEHATAPDHRLQFYATHFSLVEVDSTYYVPPTRAMAAVWCNNSPSQFVFDIKAFALMTGHPADVKRFPDWLRRLLPRTAAAAQRVYAKDLPVSVVDEVWARFQGALAPLRDAGKLGPVLLQYPRWFTPSRDSANELRAARERLGTNPAAVEFRNPAWVTGRVAERTFALLEQLQFSYVIVDAPPGTASSMPPVVRVTTPGLAVIRLHGRRTSTWEAQNNPVSERYRYLYDSGELTEWAERLHALTTELRDSWAAQPSVQFPDMAKARQGVHVVFNNCHANYGTSNADEITALLRKFDQYRLREGRHDVALWRTERHRLHERVRAALHTPS